MDPTGYFCDVIHQNAESRHQNSTIVTGFRPHPGELPVFRLSEMIPQKSSPRDSDRQSDTSQIDGVTILMILFSALQARRTERLMTASIDESAVLEP